MFNEGFWVLASFIIFAYLAYKPGKKAVLSMLDSYSQKIFKRIQEASEMKAEALTLLKKARQEYEDAVSISKKILDTSQKEAQLIMLEAKKNAETIIKKRTDAAMQRIAQDEQQIIHDIKTEAIESALKQVEHTILTELDNTVKADFVDSSVSKIKKYLH